MAEVTQSDLDRVACVTTEVALMVAEVAKVVGELAVEAGRDDLTQKLELVFVKSQLRMASHEH